MDVSRATQLQMRVLGSRGTFVEMNETLLPRWAEYDWVNINTRQEEDKSLSFRKKVKKIQEELEATDEAQRK